MLSARNSSQNMDDLTFRRSWHSNLEASTSNWLNDFAQTFTIRYDTAEWHVRLHSSSQCGLCLFRQIIELMDDNDLERFLLFLIKLLGPSDFFDELLNDDFIMVVSFTRSNFNVIIGTEYDALD